MTKHPKKIKDYLDKEPSQYAWMQVKIDVSIRDAARDIKNKYFSDKSWDDIMTACLQKFIDENGDKK